MLYSETYLDIYTGEKRLPDKEDEEILNDESMIRKAGDVHVITVPSSFMKNRQVKRSVCQKGPISIVRHGKGLAIYFEIPLEVQLSGRMLEIKQKDET